jgi:hypothetical protein
MISTICKEDIGGKTYIEREMSIGPYVLRVGLLDRTPIMIQVCDCIEANPSAVIRLFAKEDEANR